MSAEKGSQKATNHTKEFFTIKIMLVFVILLLLTTIFAILPVGEIVRTQLAQPIGEGGGSGGTPSYNRYYFPENYQAYRGQDVDVVVNGQFIRETSVYTVDLDFDNVSLTVSNVSILGTLGEGADLFYYNILPSSVPGSGRQTLRAGVVYRWVCSSQSPGIPPTTGQLFKIKFHVRETAPIGSTSLDLKGETSYIDYCTGGEVNPNVIDGTIQILG